MPTRSWYEHARAYAEMKWPDLAPKSRRSVAEALTTITLALTAGGGGPEPELTRRALFGHAFNPASASRPVPAEHRPRAGAGSGGVPAAGRAGRPGRGPRRPGRVRPHPGRHAGRARPPPGASGRCSTTRSATPSSSACCPPTPLDKIQRTAAAVAETVDRRVVASPAQAAALLAAVRAQGHRGEHLEAFFGCLYYAALRPSEAVALRDADCVLPDSGWGRIDLAASEPRAGTEWTDTGTARQDRGLKHRARRPRPAASPSRPSWWNCSATTSSGTAPAPAAGSSAPPAAGRCRTPATAKSGSAPGPRRSPPRSRQRR